MLVSVLGGGSTSRGVETLVINVITQGDSSETLGATITVTNNDTSSVISATTWQGIQITIEVPQYCNYTITLGNVAGYSTPQAQTYHSSPNFVRNTAFTYIGTGAYIESTDGILYTASNWSSAGKTANSVVLLTSNKQFRIALPQFGPFTSYDPENQSVRQIGSNKSESSVKADFNGEQYTTKMRTQGYAPIPDNDSYAFSKAWRYTFPNGRNTGFLPSMGYLWLMYQNKTAIANCMSAAGGSISGVLMSANFAHAEVENWEFQWLFNWDSGASTMSIQGTSHYCKPISNYK